MRRVNQQIAQVPYFIDMKVGFLNPLQRGAGKRNKAGIVWPHPSHRRRPVSRFFNSSTNMDYGLRDCVAIKRMHVIL